MTEPNAKAENLQFFRDHLAEYLRDPVLSRKFVVIHGRELRGAFDTFQSALQSAIAQFSPDEFVIQQVIDDTQVISFLHAYA
jgi:hypothetical protein